MSLKNFLILFVCTGSFFSNAQTPKVPSTARLVINYQFEETLPFFEGLAGVRKNGKWGFINAAGTTVIPFTWNEINPFSNGAAAVRKGSDWFLIDKKGNIKSPPLEKINLFDSLVKGKKDGKWGLFNTDLSLRLPYAYDYFYVNSDGFLLVDPVDKENADGVLSLNGDTIIPCKYKSIKYSNKHFMVVDNEDKYAFFDFSGNALTDFQFDHHILNDFHHGAAIVVKEDQFRLIDLKGETLCTDFAMILDWNTEWVIGSKGTVYSSKGVFNYRTNNWIIQPEYSSILRDEYERFICTRDDLTVIFDSTGKQIIGPLAGEFIGLRSNAFLVTQNYDTQGCYFTESQLYLEPIYQEVTFNEEGTLVIVLRDGSYSVINSAGSIISHDLQCEQYPFIAENKLAVRGENGLYGFLLFE